MRNTKKKKISIKKTLVIGILISLLTVCFIAGSSFSLRRQAKAGSGEEHVVIMDEITTKRSRFVKQFAMSDGSYTAVSYSMPVHYKKNGQWKNIDTTLL